MFLLSITLMYGAISGMLVILVCCVIICSLPLSHQPFKYIITLAIKKNSQVKVYYAPAEQQQCIYDRPYTEFFYCYFSSLLQFIVRRKLPCRAEKFDVRIISKSQTATIENTQKHSQRNSWQKCQKSTFARYII